MANLSFPKWNDVDVRLIVGATLALGLVVKLSLQQGKQKNIYRSPRETLLPKLTEQEKSDLPYPPEVLPGRRDVDTPYGTIRVYEFGPETGRKVLLVHGISTPCISLGAISEGLAEKGCRVMLFDLWGRGYSDTPEDLDHDNRLYTSQIMFVLTSSDLPWKTFDLIGYSLGGGIAMGFASYFPQMVHSLILLAPAGLIRPHHFERAPKFFYSSGLFPEGLIKWIVKRRLQSGPISRNARLEAKKKPGVKDVINAEAKDSPESSQEAPLSTSHPNVNISEAVQWQIRAHTGFVHAFVSSIRHAPIAGQQATWKRVGLLLSPQITPQNQGLHDKVLILAGSTDVVIVPAELKEDIHSLIGENGYQWDVIEGGHDFPSTRSVETVRLITEFWGW